MSLPLVSVGIPTYNRLSTLRRAVESVLAQTYVNIELVISDNASSDGTLEYCTELSNKFKHVIYVRQPINKGAFFNFNATLDISHGTYFMWLGDDDWLSAEHIEECVESLLANLDCVLVAGCAVYWDGALYSTKQLTL